MPFTRAQAKKELEALTATLKLSEELQARPEKKVAGSRSKPKQQPRSIVKLKVDIGVLGLARQVRRVAYRRDRKVYSFLPYKFAFNHNPFPSHAHKPSIGQMEEAFEIMKIFHKQKFGQECHLDISDSPENRLESGTNHGEYGITVDNIIKVLFSQATDNDAAHHSREHLRHKYDYLVNGQEVIGTIPNYHKIMTAPESEIAKCISNGGFQNKRAVTIKKLLRCIADENERLAKESGVAAPAPGNEPNAKDFVPGQLSLSFLAGKTKEELMKFYLSLPEIGVKCAACLLCFNHQMPIFVVDTHLMRLCQWLGWLPTHTIHEDDAATYLDCLIPDRLKYGLHQAFWNHGKLCEECRSQTRIKKEATDGLPCPFHKLGLYKFYRPGAANTGEKKRSFDEVDDQDAEVVQKPAQKKKRASKDSTSTEDDEITLSTSPQDSSTPLSTGKRSKRKPSSMKFASGDADASSPAATGEPGEQDSTPPTETLTLKAKKLEGGKLLFHELTQEEGHEYGAVLTVFPVTDDDFGLGRAQNLMAREQILWKPSSRVHKTKVLSYEQARQQIIDGEFDQLLATPMKLARTTTTEKAKSKAKAKTNVTQAARERRSRDESLATAAALDDKGAGAGAGANTTTTVTTSSREKITTTTTPAGTKQTTITHWFKSVTTTQQSAE